MRNHRAFQFTHRPPLIAFIVRLHPRFALVAPSRGFAKLFSAETFLLLPSTRPAKPKTAKRANCIIHVSPLPPSAAPKSVLFVLVVADKASSRNIGSFQGTESAKCDHKSDWTLRFDSIGNAFRSRHPPLSLTRPLSLSLSPRGKKKKTGRKPAAVSLSLCPPPSLPPPHQRKRWTFRTSTRPGPRKPPPVAAR